MSNLITCPACKSEFAVTDALKSELNGQVRAELEAEYGKKYDALQTQETQVRKALQAAKQKAEAVEEELAKRLGEAREKLKNEAALVAKQEMAVELEDRTNQIQELSKKVANLQSQELDLRERERKLAAEQEELKLKAVREADAQRKQIREEALAQFKDEHELKQAEQDKEVSELKQKIDELKQKAEQGSQQTQGEVQELALEAMLGSIFSRDLIEPVGKGVRGADAQQRVVDSSGNECGSILWESKRTKAWQKDWLVKLRDDQRAANADCAVIVTQAMPPGVRNITLLDGVWVCSWACAEGLARALRYGLLEAGKNRLASQGRGEKKELVYAYLSGQEFKRCIEGIVESFVTMKHELDKEKRSMTATWKRREKLIERACGSAAGLYGDLRGIIGNSLPEVAELSLSESDDQPPALSVNRQRKVS